MKTILKGNVLLLAALTFFHLGTSAYAQITRLQLIHNSPDTLLSQVDVYMNGSMVADNLSFQSATPFIDAPVGLVEVVVAPAASTGPQQGISNFNLQLSLDSTYVVAMSGTMSPGFVPQVPFQLSVYPLGQEEAMNPGTTDMLVFNGISDITSLNVEETFIGLGTVADQVPHPNFANYFGVVPNDLVLLIQDDGPTPIEAFVAPLGSLDVIDEAVVLVASGFLNPELNNDGPTAALYLAFPDGGALLELPSSTSSLEEQTANAIEVYPNPAQEEIHLKADFSGEMSFKILDQKGSLHSSGTLGEKRKVDISQLAGGTYILWTKQDGRVHIQKFVKN